MGAALLEGADIERGPAWELRLLLLQAAVVVGARDAVEPAAAAAQAMAGSPVERAEVALLLVEDRKSRRQYPDALDIGLDALAALGESLPRSPGKRHVVSAILSGRLALRSVRARDIDDHRELDDPSARAAMRLMQGLSTAAYFAEPDLMPLLVLRMVRLSVRSGVCAESAYGFASYGFILAGVLGQIHQGVAWGRLGLRLLARFEAQQLAAGVGFVYWAFTHHWARPLRETHRPMMEAAAAGLQTGDLEYYTYNVFVGVNYRWLAGDPLDGIATELEAHRIEVERHRQDRVRNLAVLFGDLLCWLRGRPSGDSEPARAEAWDEARATGDYNYLAYLHMYRAVQAYFEDDPQRVADACEHVFDEHEPMLGHAFLPFCLTLRCLALLDLAADTTGSEQRQLLSQVREGMRRLGTWAESAPANYRHRYQLVESARRALTDRPPDALLAYESAISLAREQNAHVELAIATERAGRLCLRLGMESAARGYLADARAALMRWGADGPRRPARGATPLARSRPQRREPGAQPELRSPRPRHGHPGPRRPGHRRGGRGGRRGPGPPRPGAGARRGAAGRAALCGPRRCIQAPRRPHGGRSLGRLRHLRPRGRPGRPQPRHRARRRRPARRPLVPRPLRGGPPESLPARRAPGRHRDLPRGALPRERAPHPARSRRPTSRCSACSPARPPSPWPRRPWSRSSGTPCARRSSSPGPTAASCPTSSWRPSATSASTRSSSGTPSAGSSR